MKPLGFSHPVFHPKMGPSQLHLPLQSCFVIFYSVFRRQGDIRVVESFSELFRNWLGIFVECTNYVAIVDVIGVYKCAGAKDYTA